MKRLSLKALSIILFGGAVVAWFQEPSRRVDWIPLFVIGFAVSLVDVRLDGLEKRLAMLAETSSSEK